MATLLDLSQKGDLLLGALIGRVNAIVGDAPYLLAGAAPANPSPPLAPVLVRPS